MKYRIVTRLIFTATLTWLLALPLLAQAPRQGGQGRDTVTREINGRTVTVERPAVVTLTEANFEQYRNDLRAILHAQKETAKMMRLSDKVDEVADSALAHIESLKYSDFVNMKATLVDLSGLKEAVVSQQSIVAQALSGAKTQYAPTDPLPGAQYSLNLCPLNPQPAEVAFISGIVLLAAELVRTVALNGCLQVISAFFAGGNASLACTVSDIIYNVARIVNYPISFCDSDTDAGEIKGGYLRAEYVKDQVAFSINNDNANKAALTTQLTNAENHVITNANNNASSLSSQINQFQALALRTAIERNLVADPTTVAAVGLFQLPATRGGYLELVRQVVSDTYAAQLASAGTGVVVYNPSTELSLGATLTSQGKYREAYYYYRKAYRSVVKYP